MMIRSGRLLILLVGTVALAQAAFAQNPPTVSIDRGCVSDRVYLSPMDSAAQNNFARIWETPRYLDYQPYALLMTNASGQSIVAVTVRWSGTKAGDSGVFEFDSATDSLRISQMGAGTTFSLPLPGRPRTMDGHGGSWAAAQGEIVIANGDRMLVAPGVFVKEDVTRQRTSVGSSASLDAKLKSADTVSACLDVVVLEGGLVLGPDQSHTIDKMRAGKAAIDDLSNAVKAAEQSGQNALDVLRKLADTSRPTDPAMATQARIARMLSMSPQWRVRLEQMAAIPLPNFHR